MWVNSWSWLASIWPSQRVVRTTLLPIFYNDPVQPHMSGVILGFLTEATYFYIPPKYCLSSCSTYHLNIAFHFFISLCTSHRVWHPWFWYSLNIFSKIVFFNLFKFLALLMLFIFNSHWDTDPKDVHVELAYRLLPLAIHVYIAYLHVLVCLDFCFNILQAAIVLTLLLMTRCLLICPLDIHKNYVMVSFIFLSSKLHKNIYIA